MHGLDQALTLLHTGLAAEVPLRLRSADGAIAYGGIGWFQSIAQQAHAAVPGADADFSADCSGEPALAHAAIRAGWKLIRFPGHSAAAGKIAAIAEQEGVALDQLTGPVFDAGVDESTLKSRFEDWLRLKIR